MNRITDLVTKLTAARDAYYNGTPIMSDAAFDALEDELRRLDPTNAFFTKVGAPATSGWAKVKHSQPMGSLNKAQTSDDFTGWYKAVGSPEVVVMRKCDGASLSLRYENGKLVQAVTRGDGEIGEDITRNVLNMKGVIRVVPNQWSGHIRAEVVCKHDDFKAHFPGQSNPRNTANGTMKRQSDADACKHLSVITYQVLPDAGPLKTKVEEFAALEAWGFETAGCHVAHSAADVEAEYHRFISFARKDTPYDIDGLVVEVNDEGLRADLGTLNGKPKGAIAYKFPHEEKETFLRDVIWQVGPSGRVTPVAVFDEVILGGVKVNRASLHNVSNMAALAEDHPASGGWPSRGDKILVARRNDVIPYVESIIQVAPDSPITFCPSTSCSHCPACQTPLVMDGEYLVCRGDNCPAQTKGAITRWISKIGVLHFGESLVEALMEAGMVEDIADLYTVDPHVAAKLVVSNRLAGGTATKAFANLNARKELDLHVFLGSLGIPLIGRSMAQTIVNGGFDTLDKISQATPAQIAAIPGVGQTKAVSFVKGFWDRISLIAKLLSVGVTIKRKIVGAMTGKSMCVTGFRDQDLCDAFEAQGGTVKSGVSRGLDYLVAKDPTDNSGKLAKARQYGTKVIGIDDMKQLLGI